MRLSLLHKLDAAHDDSVWAAAWAPGSNTLVTGSVDETVKLWGEEGDALTQQHHLVRGGAAGAWAVAAGRRPVPLPTAHAHPPTPPRRAQLGLSLGVVGVAVDATGQQGAASSLDSHVTVWGMGDYAMVTQFKDLPPTEVWGLAYLPPSAGDKTLLAVAGGSANCVRLLDVGAAQQAAALEMPAAAAASAAAGGEGAEGGSQQQQQQQQQRGKERFVLSVSASPDGRRIAAGGCLGGWVLRGAAGRGVGRAWGSGVCARARMRAWVGGG